MSTLATQSTAEALRSVEFRLSGAAAPSAQRVPVAATFNNWDRDLLQMQKDPDGDWRVVVHLPPGVYPYLYCVDGMWQNDPDDDGRALTGWGNSYSLKAVG